MWGSAWGFKRLLHTLFPHCRDQTHLESNLQQRWITPTYLVWNKKQTSTSSSDIKPKSMLRTVKPNAGHHAVWEAIHLLCCKYSSWIEDTMWDRAADDPRFMPFMQMLVFLHNTLYIVVFSYTKITQLYTLKGHATFLFQFKSNSFFFFYAV